MGKIIRKVESGNNILVIGVQDFKKKLMDYFKTHCCQVTLNRLMKDFKLDLDDLDALQFCVDELVKEKYLIKLQDISHYEYGLRKEHGGIY